MFGDSAGEAAKLIISVFPFTHGIMLQNMSVGTAKSENRARKHKSAMDGRCKGSREFGISLDCDCLNGDLRWLIPHASLSLQQPRHGPGLLQNTSY